MLAKKFLTIVTGATNVKENDIVPVALVGQRVPWWHKNNKKQIAWG